MDNGDCDGTGVFLDVLIGNLFFWGGSYLLFTLQ